MERMRRDSATPYLADILGLLAILKSSSDPETKEYIFEELRKYFVAQKQGHVTKSKAA